MVVGGLAKGPMRFNALLRLIGGVSHRMLTLTLRGLEHDGLVKRTVYPSVPPKVEYQLTEVGRSLIKPLSALSEWVQRISPPSRQPGVLNKPSDVRPQMRDCPSGDSPSLNGLGASPNKNPDWITASSASCEHRPVRLTRTAKH